MQSNYVYANYNISIQEKTPYAQNISDVIIDIQDTHMGMHSSEDSFSRQISSDTKCQGNYNNIQAAVRNKGFQVI